MKLCNIVLGGETHLAIDTARGMLDATAAGFAGDMDQVIRGTGLDELSGIAMDESLPLVEAPVYANVVNKTGKLVCVGLNYRAHASGIHMKTQDYPVLFSKFDNALVPAGTDVTLPPWESSYDYEAELVIVMGKTAWNVSPEEAKDFIFGYTCGNDFSVRDAQMRSGQWLIGKTMPGFGPCGPGIVTADSFDPESGKQVRSYVNGVLRQNGSTDEMIFSCAQIVSYASKYIRLEPGDLIFTGTPSGVALEEQEKVWLKPGDLVDVYIEDIGTLTNRLV
ncbi:MAG: fumarylacetoacetate hydrolase family protein [Candidatus Limivicinus sp.]